MMNTRVILIVALVVAGAILLTKHRKKNGSTEEPFQKQFSSRNEISLTANVIIGELDEEAMEALPSDLKPNIDGLTLTDEDKTELFAILNSVTDSGVLGALGSSSPLGASARTDLVKTKNQITRKIRLFENRMKLLKEKMAKTKNPRSRAKLAGQIKSAQSESSRNDFALKAIVKKINRLKAKGKDKTKTNVVAEESSAKLKSLVSQKERLRVKYFALLKNRRALMNNVKALERQIKAKKISSKNASEWKRNLERKYKATTKSIDSIRKSGIMIEGKISAEKRRIVAVKKQSLEKARQTKRAHETEVAAKKLLQESEKKSAVTEAGVKKAKSVLNRQVLEVKRRAQKAQKMARAQKEHAEKVSEADRARREYEVVQEKKKATALAKGKAALKHKKESLTREAARAKAAMKAEKKKEKQRVDAAKAMLKAAEAKQLEKAAHAYERAKAIKSEGKRKNIQAAIRKKAADEEKKRHEAAKKMAAIAQKRQKRFLEKGRRLETKFQNDTAIIRRKEQEIARLEEMNKAKAVEQAAKAAQVAADRKQRELDQRKRDQQARALKQKQLALESQKEAEKIEAAAALEKAKRDVAAKKAHSAKKRHEHMEARARLRKHKAEEAEKARKKKVAELEQGIEKISGMSSDSIDLSGLDKTVLLELKVFIEASDGHHILPAVIKMIELKSKKEEEEEEEEDEMDDGDDQNEDRPMTPEQIREDFFKNVQRITGIIPDGPGSMVALDMEVLEELLAYSKTLTTGRLATFSKHVEEIIFSKKLITVAKQNGVTITPGMHARQVTWSSANIVSLGKILEFLNSEPRFAEEWLNVVQVVHRNKTVQLVLEREAAEEARAKKQAEELDAIEKARVAQAEKDLAKAAAKLEQDRQKLDTEIVRVNHAVTAEKQRVIAEHQKEVESIAREHEKEKQVMVEEVKQELKEVEEEIVVEAREQIQEVDAATESKLVEMKQEQAEVENEQRAEAIEVVVTIEAEISNTEDQAVAEALRQNLEEQKASRARVLEETAKTNALEQQAVVEEANALKEEIEKSTISKIKEENTIAQEKLESAVETVEQEKQDLIEAKEKVQEIEVEKVDLEGTVQIDLLEQQKNDVEDDKEIVEDTSIDDIVEDTVHPRASKEDMVKTARKRNPDGSSFIKMGVPSDMSPGESDNVSILLSKEAGELLAQYHDIYKKIGENGSLENVSAEDKKVLASAGAEFKRIRGQYVEQRKEKVLARTEQLTLRMTD
ncbi:unnamed protein product [Ectocarpus sp. 4 AP-2014]|uniref:EsV-1-171 n=1 Tax=Ectocarpus siliculosus virus 1 (isolate New Zealand/Kaikoura/1988) TaxID=654926 RepID=Q8QKU9_ESV1K|nr:EsV-1-171 [Ectocarpus siliculosus virus 1]AAK14585.1 EsV-1-171 [Ectocarpus siliculosus virus 1]